MRSAVGFDRHGAARRRRLAPAPRELRRRTISWWPPCMSTRTALLIFRHLVTICRHRVASTDSGSYIPRRRERRDRHQVLAEDLECRLRIRRKSSRMRRPARAQHSSTHRPESTWISGLRAALESASSRAMIDIAFSRTYHLSRFVYDRRIHRAMNALLCD